MENKCEICNSETELVDVIGKEDIMNICKVCADKNDFPIIQKPTQDQINRSVRFRPVHERLSISAGIKPKEQSSIKTSIQSLKKKDYPELIDNFHWHIQQARRFKKMSEKQLSESIGEPEVLISMAEEGKLPEDYDKLINKFEQFLKIQLRKESKKTDLNKINNNNDSDLKQAKEEMIISEVGEKLEEKSKKGFWSRFFGSSNEVIQNEEDMEDIDNIEEIDMRKDKD